MDGIKNYGYNNIELESNLFNETIENLQQMISSGLTYDLTNDETDLTNRKIHSNYDVDKLAEFLSNGNFSTMIIKYSVIANESPQEFSVRSEYNETYYNTPNKPNKFFTHTGVLDLGSTSIVVQFDFTVWYVEETGKYKMYIDFALPN